jgi:hypothetical protein
MSIAQRALQRAYASGKTVRNYGPRYVWKDWEYINRSRWTDEPEAEYAEHCRQSIADGYWTLKAPNWWHRHTGHTPAKVFTRALLRRTLHLKDFEDTPLFPDRALSYRGYW